MGDCPWWHHVTNMAVVQPEQVVPCINIYSKERKDDKYFQIRQLIDGKNEIYTKYYKSGGNTSKLKLGLTYEKRENLHINIDTTNQIQKWQIHYTRQMCIGILILFI